METQGSIKNILETENIITYFQPVVSLREGRMVAVEALTRGINPETGEILSPGPLIAEAREKSLSLEFDRLCRKKAIETFSKIPNRDKYSLFMNIESSLLASGEDEAAELRALVQNSGIKSEYIGIEICGTENTADCLSFADIIRKEGYMLLLDNIGTQQANLEQIIAIQPDFVKIDRSVTSNIQGDFFRQSVLKTVCSLSQQTGSVCIAEGIETMEELYLCHQLGIDLFQGFLFCRPEPDFTFLEEKTAADLSDQLTALNDRIGDSIAKQIERQWLYERAVSEALGKLKKPEDLQNAFALMSEEHPEIEGIYLLDSEGFQITEALHGKSGAKSPARALYSSPGLHTNHSLKPYFYFIRYMKISRYFTETYLSPITGNICRTMALEIDHPAFDNAILCIDFAVSYT